MQPAVAYVRVSTREQGHSGLGLDAQRAALARFAEQEQFNIIATFTEVASAKGDEIEHFGWNLPPASFRRGQSVHAPLPSF